MAVEDGLRTRMSPKMQSPPEALSHPLLSSKAPSPLVKFPGNVEKEREKDQLSGPQAVFENQVGQHFSTQFLERKSVYRNGSVLVLFNVSLLPLLSLQLSAERLPGACCGRLQLVSIQDPQCSAGGPSLQRRLLAQEYQRQKQTRPQTPWSQPNTLHWTSGSLKHHPVLRRVAGAYPELCGWRIRICSHCFLYGVLSPLL